MSKPPTAPPAPPTATPDSGVNNGSGEMMATGYDPNGAGMEAGCTSYYKADGTFVYVTADGTEYHYPPETDGGNGTGDDVATTVGEDGVTLVSGAPPAPRENPLEEARFYPPRERDPPPTGPINPPMQRQISRSATDKTELVPRQGGANSRSASTTGARGASNAATSHQAGDTRAVNVQDAGKSDHDDAQPGDHLLEEEDTSAITTGYWIGDLATEIFISAAFKCYFVLIMYMAFVLEYFIGFNWMWACLYRMFQPPDADREAFWQSLIFLSIFLVLSVTMAGMLTIIWESVKEFWSVTKRTTSLWGFEPSMAPVWALYAIVIILTTFTPLLWSLIQCLAEQHSAVWFLQHLCFSVIIMTLMVTLVLYVWMFGLSIWHKKSAHQLERLQEDDGEDVNVPAGNGTAIGVVNPSAVAANTQHHHGGAAPPVATTVSWFHHQSILREYGLDARTLMWMIVVFLVGMVPSFIVAILMATQGTTVTWNIAWTAITIAFLLFLAILREMTNSKHKSNAALLCLALTILFIILSLVGAGASGNPTLFALYLGLGVACQFFCLRKRPYTYGRKEVRAVLGLTEAEKAAVAAAEAAAATATANGTAGAPAQVVDPVDDTYDSYLFCCKNSCWTLLSPCFNVRGFFTQTHPRIERLEKVRRLQRKSLWADQKMLLVYWSTFWIVLVGLISYTQATAVIFKKDVSLRSNQYIAPGNLQNLLGVPATSIYASNQTHPLCTTKFNTKSTGSASSMLKIYDLVLLSTLGYSFGGQWSQDFQGWFSQTGLMQIGRPVPGNIEAAVGNNGYAQWIDYVDNSTGFHFINVRGIDEGLAFMRNVDIWGESLTLTAASVLAPFISFWPTSIKQDFVAGIGFFKAWSGGNNATEGLERYVQQVLNTKLVIPTTTTRATTTTTTTPVPTTTTTTVPATTTATTLQQTTSGSSGSPADTATTTTTTTTTTITTTTTTGTAPPPPTTLLNNGTTGAPNDSNLIYGPVSTGYHQVLLFGHGQSGGIARLVGSKLGVPSVGFATPGLTWITKKYSLSSSSLLNSLHIKSTQNVVGLVDDNGNDGSQILIPCQPGMKTEQLCDSIVWIQQTVLQLCGDLYGRSIDAARAAIMQQ